MTYPAKNSADDDTGSERSEHRDEPLKPPSNPSGGGGVMDIAEAYFEAVQAIGSKIAERPLPQGLNSVEAGDWSLTLNASGEERQHEGTSLPPWNVLAANNKYLAVAILAPNGGMVGGMTEAEFIEELRALNAPTNRSEGGGDG